MDDRNGYMLKGISAKRGYDWWWHSLVGISVKTGEKRPFFIEYYVINPALGGESVIPGQLPENHARGSSPPMPCSRQAAGAKEWRRNSITFTRFRNSQPIQGNWMYTSVLIMPVKLTWWER